MKVFHGRTLPPNLGETDKFQNARYFSAPLEGAKEAYVEAGYPDIVAAYQTAKIPVHVIGTEENRPEPVKLTKDQVIEQLKAASIEHNPKAPLEDLLKLLPAPPGG